MEILNFSNGSSRLFRWQLRPQQAKSLREHSFPLLLRPNSVARGIFEILWRPQKTRRLEEKHQRNEVSHCTIIKIRY
jgi:hypothetical protein